VNSTAPQARRDALLKFGQSKKDEGLPEVAIRQLLEEYHIDTYDMSYVTMNDDLERVYRRLFK
jgi:ADP-ribose pyrophosphatase YjhB (NUDIX family)